MSSPAAMGSTRTPSSRPPSLRSSHSARSSRSRTSTGATEETPLLLRESRYPSNDEHDHDSDTERPRSLAESSLLRSLHFSKFSSKRSRRWPSIVALMLLCVSAILIMLLRFFVPEAVSEYAKQALEFHPTNISLDSLTDNGVRIRVKGDVMLDASKVSKGSIRGVGRFATWLAKEVESDPAEVSIYLPGYGNELACTAKVPGIKLDVRNKHLTQLDFLTEINPGNNTAIRNLASDWLDGRTTEVRLRGKAVVPLRSGIISVGRQTIVHDLSIDRSLLPTLPTNNLNVTKLNIYAGSENSMRADATVTVPNDSIFGVSLPPIGFDILVDNCRPADPYIKVANGSSGVIHVLPKSDVKLVASASLNTIPADLTRKCKGTEKSPFDALTYGFSHGQAIPVYVKCCSFPDPTTTTPQWVSNLLKDFATIPVPFPGKSLNHLVRNFSLADTQFSLPDPLATPGTPEAQPRISAVIKALVSIPEEINFPLNVSKVRANAVVYYKENKLGKLDLSKWQQANSSRVDAHHGDGDDDEGAALLVQSNVEKAPLEIVDEDVFSEVVQLLLFGGKSVLLTVKAEVDVEIDTLVGPLVVRQLPAEGAVPVKPISTSGKGFKHLKPSVHGLQIVETTPESLTLQAQVNFTNPTNYSASIPYVSINILTNDTVLGQAIAENVSVVPGPNADITVRAIWEPGSASGDIGKAVGRELISQYLSGYNTSLTFRTHRDTFPSMPSFGEALSHFSIEVPTPRLHSPEDPSKKPDDGNDDDEGDFTGPHFIKSSTLHVFSSTAVFSLVSPLNKSTLYIESINATAWYHDDPVGHILHNLPFAVPPGYSDTPRLPVEWSLGSVGYEAVRKALGGTLNVNATADVGVRLGQWKDKLWFRGRGIGAHIRM